MNHVVKIARTAIIASLFAALCYASYAADSGQGRGSTKERPAQTGSVVVHRAIAFDVSAPLATSLSSQINAEPSACTERNCGLSPDDLNAEEDPAPAPKPVIKEAGAAVEQKF